MSHPRGIEPFGSSMIQSAALPIRDNGIGPFSVLDDGLMLELLSYMNSTDLATLMVTSKSFYCFASYDELWKNLVLSEFEARFTWAGRTWKEAFVATKYPRFNAERQPPTKKRKSKKDSSDGQDCLKVSGFYSDLLYQPWRCATIDLESNGWLEVDNIVRVSALSCTVDDFRERFEVPNRPVVIEDIVNQWPAFKKWTPGYINKAFSGKDIIAGNYLMDYTTYQAYSVRSSVPPASIVMTDLEPHPRRTRPMRCRSISLTRRSSTLPPTFPKTFPSHLTSLTTSSLSWALKDQTGVG